MSSFNANGKRSDGSVLLRSICKGCGSRRKTVETAKMKICASCKKKKPTTDFPERGIHPYCRPCKNEKVYEYRRGPGRAAHNERMGRYQKDKYDNDPEFRLKTSARHAVQRALKSGKLKRPHWCPSCHRVVRLHAHHHQGYDKANWLNIIWLCARCHREEEVA